MKRSVLFIVTLLCVNALMSQTRFLAGDLRFEVISTNEVQVYDCKTSVTEVYIPSIVTNNGKTYHVTSIGPEAFNHCTALTSINIPTTITYIGNKAFFYCSSLTSIVIPNNVVSIGNFAFSECSNLHSISFGSSLNLIGENAFSGCISLDTINLPNRLRSIGYKAFYNCTSLSSIIIPNSVTSIGYQAFYNCTSLTNIIIPNNVTFIGKNAFSFCTSLTYVTCLAKTAPTLEKNVFDNTPDNKTLDIPFGCKYESWKNATNWEKINYRNRSNGQIS